MKEKIKSKKKFDDDIDEVIKNGKKKDKVNKKHSFRKAKNKENTED